MINKQMESNKNLLFRIVLILLLTFIISFTIIYKRSIQTQSSPYLEKWEDAKIRFIYRVVYLQILLMKQLPLENQKVMQEQIFQQLSILSNEYEDKPEVHIHNYIIFQHLSFRNLNQKLHYEIPENIKKQKQYQSRIQLLEDIYVKRKKPIAIHSDLFRTSIGKIALLDYYSYADSKKEKELYQILLQETMPFQFVLTGFMFFMFFSFFAGFFIMLKFFSKRTPELYGNLIRSFHTKEHWIFLESAVIYLFLYIPVNFVITEMLSGILKKEIYLYYQVFYMIIIFLIVFIYLKNEVGEKVLFHSLWIKVYSHKNFVGLIQEFEEKQKDSNQSDKEEQHKNFFKQLEDVIQKKQLKPISPFKEIWYGILGFIVVFPISVIVLLFSLFVRGSDIQNGDAHPIVFFISQHFWVVLILAVVIAPITEEIIFRNWIYGFFRSRFSVLVSALFSAIIFAGLHPQGVVAYPYLIFLGIALALFREYRPGIIAPIITHALINLLAVMMNFMFYQILFF